MPQMIVPSLDIWKTQYPHLPDIQIKITEVWQLHDGLVNGRCEYQGQTYYFIWTEDEDTDYFIKRVFAVIRAPEGENTPMEDGQIIGWFIEGEADYEKWNSLRKSHQPES